MVIVQDGRKKYFYCLKAGALPLSDPALNY